MTYTWKEFNLSEAINGALVGIPTVEPQPGGTIDEDIPDISKVAGKLVKTDVNSKYKVVINGGTIYFNAEGWVISSTPTPQQQMYIATAVISSTVGTVITRSDGGETGYDDQVTLSVMEPRDSFAIQILSAMLVHAGNPETFDDASIRMYSDAAYRWAQGMMDAAANTRHGQSITPSTNININTNDLQSNTEKLLYNMSKSLEQGIVVKGSNALGAEPVHAKITSMPDITIDGLENVTEAYTIPEIGSITINASVFNQKFIRFEVQTYMTYSDVSVYLTLAVKEGATTTTRNVGYIIPKGSVVTIMPLDDAVTEITSISTKSVRGKGGNDPNSYAFA